MASVLLYVPNLIGYVRLLLLVVAWTKFEDPPLFLISYCSSALLDGFDGFFARKLCQTSTFGAWLDVWTDNIGRTMLWSNVTDWGWMVACLEWSVFVSTHRLGSRWKEEFRMAPIWVKKVMENGFYTPLGAFTVAGIHGLPLALYYRSHPFLWSHTPVWLHWTVIGVLGLGRCLCAAVEVWVVLTHIKLMVEVDQPSPQQPSTGEQRIPHKTDT